MECYIIIVIDINHAYACLIELEWTEQECERLKALHTLFMEINVYYLSLTQNMIAP